MPLVDPSYFLPWSLAYFWWWRRSSQLHSSVWSLLRANLKTGVWRKQSTPNFPKKEHFLPAEKHPFWDSPFCLITEDLILKCSKLLSNTPASIYLLKVNNGNTRTIPEICLKSMISFWCLYSKLWTDFTYCSSVSIGIFERVNVGLDITYTNGHFGKESGFYLGNCKN